MICKNIVVIRIIIFNRITGDRIAAPAEIKCNVFEIFDQGEMETELYTKALSVYKFSLPYQSVK